MGDRIEERELVNNNKGTVCNFVQPLEGYRILSTLGKGTQGEVYLAQRESDGLRVAIKRLNIGSVKHWKEYDLFRREAATLAALDIDGVAKFYDAVECLDANPPCSYIIQEYISGRSLATMLKQGHRFTLDQVYGIVIRLLEILYTLHNYDPPIIHRDIKPSNIMVQPGDDERYRVWLIDFGAVANPSVQGGGSTVAGTFGYMPPEQLMGKPVPASDIYALAAVMVHLLSGISPADMPVRDFHLIFEPDLQALPVDLVRTLQGMLEPNEDKRLCDIIELLHTFIMYRAGKYGAEKGTGIQSLNVPSYWEEAAKVDYFAQEGSIELWNRLPLERGAIPRVYQNVIQQYHEYCIKRIWCN